MDKKQSTSDLLNKLEQEIKKSDPVADDEIIGVHAAKRPKSD